MILIEKYSKKHEGAFEKIWVDWLRITMGIEPQERDVEEVRHPIESYIVNGGIAFYAVQDDACVGVVAIKKLNASDYEFCKLVVGEQARKMGLGKKLVASCMEYAKEQGGAYLYLQSFYKLEIALNMYRAIGFVETTAPDGMFVVKRTEIIMKLKL